MTSQLLTDCLNEIIEHLKEDCHTLHSCLLVNRLWCEISVRILWRNIGNFESSCQSIINSSILNTLFTCLPNESKEILHRNEIFISIPISKQPLFNYAKFCKALSIYEIGRLVDNIFRNKISFNSLSLKDRNYIVTNEFIKMFSNQISSLKKLSCYHNYYPIKFSFPYFPGVRDLSELHCCSCLPPNFFYQLSQLCHNLRTLSIDFDSYNISNELKELISLQKNLKNLKLSAKISSCASIIPTLKKHSNTVTKLHLYGNSNNLPYSFVSSFTNLQEFIFSFMGGSNFEDFRMLQYVNFSKLQTLKIPYQFPKPEYLMKFLENNGKNLKNFYTDESNKDLSLSIPDFCPNLKSLFLLFHKDELDALKTIFIKCQHLESIKVWCGKGYFNEYLSEKEIFDTVARYSPNNFCKLKIYSLSNSHVSLKDLESFFISWRKRIPKKPLSLINIKGACTSFDDYEENMKIIIAVFELL
ncbi:hypothetical protein RclHR1_08510008 [Rhizophagus clarus]|nr:hypothetical protein RclHR1_08510008 [Rhizophagus clarus]